MQPGNGPYRDLLWRPRVEVDRLDPGDVDPEVPVDARTPDAQKHSEVPGGPPGALAVAVHAVFVVFILQQLSKQGLGKRKIKLIAN